MNSGKIVLGVMAGIAVGAFIGLLFAPEKGERTRKSIVRKGEDLLDDLNDQVEEHTEELKHVLNGNLETLKKLSQTCQPEKVQ